MIFKENTFLFLIDIQCDAAEMTCFERIEERGGIDEFAAAGINKVGTMFHLLNGVVAKEMKGLRREWEVQGDDVAVLQQGGQRCVFNDVLGGPICSRHQVVGDDAATEAAEDLSNNAPDLACTNNTYGFSGEVEADESNERKVMFADAVICAVDVAIKREQEADSVFRNSVGRVSGHAHDSEAEFLGSFEIDVVEAGTAQGDELYAALGKFGDTGAIDAVVHKGAYREHSGGGSSRLRAEAEFMELPSDILAVQGMVEVFAVVRFDVVKRGGDHSLDLPKDLIGFP